MSAIAAIRRRLLAFLALPLLALAEDLVICPACRREAPPGAMFCPKCGAAISGGAQQQADDSKPGEPPAEAPSPAATQPAATADIGKAAAEGVRACAQVGMDQLKGGHPEIARVLFDNALALASLHPDALTPEQGKKLQEETRRCDDLLSRTLAECPTCKGSGRATMKVTSLLGTSNSDAFPSSVTSGTRCSTCGGSGRTARRRTVAERKTVQSAGAKGAETVFRSLGFAQEGNAWLPQTLADALDVRLRCRLRHAAASPCAQCLGLGLEDCRKCGSTGYVPCQAKNCQGGWGVEDVPNRLNSASAALKKRTPCPECGGTAKVPCATCQGRGAQPCARCAGSGKRATCPTCGGDGHAACKACDGTGKAKRRGKAKAADASPETPCAICGGEGVVFCRTCHGDGHAAR